MGWSRPCESGKLTGGQFAHQSPQNCWSRRKSFVVFCAVRPSLGTMTSATEYLGGLDWTPRPLPRSSDRCVQELLGPTVLRTSCSGPLVWQGAGRLFNMKQTLVPLFGVNLRCQQPPPKYGAKTLTTFCRILAAFAPANGRTISTMPSMVVTGVLLFWVNPTRCIKKTDRLTICEPPSMAITEVVLRSVKSDPKPAKRHLLQDVAWDFAWHGVSSLCFYFPVSFSFGKCER